MLRFLRERARRAALAMDRGRRAALARLSTLSLPRLAGPRGGGSELTLAPQDLRTADPVLAADILAGRFAFAGKLVTVPPGRSVFAMPAPSEEWAAALHAFDWLRHPRGQNTAAGRAFARGLIEDWRKREKRRRGVAWRPEIAARRILSWLAHAPFLMEDADFAFYRRFVGALAAQLRHLERAAGAAEPGAPCLLVRIALAAGAICLEGKANAERRASARLAREIARQIAPDGGHVSRSPVAVVDLLADLLPLRHAYVARGLAPPAELIGAIDRMMAFLRLARHGDGALALFNGTGATAVDLVAMLLAYDDARGPAPGQAADTGFQRLERNGLVAILDAGPPPPPALSREAHAGTLAFECSDGPQRLIVNCGVPPHGRAAWRELARASAAHSTLIVADTSSSRFGPPSPSGAPILSGPRAVAVERDPNGAFVAASHDGYTARFRLIHRRRLAIEADGVLSGLDEIVPSRARGALADAPFALRFHLHPSVRASMARDGRTVLLLVPGRGAWEFVAEDGEIAVEDTVFLGGAEGARRADQIVVRGRTRATPVVSWRLARRPEKPTAPRRPSRIERLPF